MAEWHQIQTRDRIKKQRAPAPDGRGNGVLIEVKGTRMNAIKWRLPKRNDPACHCCHKAIVPGAVYYFVHQRDKEYHVFKQYYCSACALEMDLNTQKNLRFE